MWIQLLALLALVMAAQAERTFAEFEIRKKHTSGDKATAVGKLNLNFLQTYNTLEPEIRTYLDELITEEDFKEGHQAIIEFVCVDTDIPEYKNRIYTTSVDEISSEPHGQKIAIILGPHSDSIAINAINYVQVARSLARLANGQGRFSPRSWRARSRRMKSSSIPMLPRPQKWRTTVSGANT
jgi:hypothetical protein